MDKILNIAPVRTYEDIDNQRYIIYKDNWNKAGVYRLINKKNNKSYVGSSIKISNRLKTYLSLKNMNIIIKREKSLIYSAIVKQGYSSFILDILEYSDTDVAVEKEQYYINILNSAYNILKIANSRSGYTHKVKTKLLLSIASRKNAIICRSNFTKIVILPKKIEEKTINVLSLRSQGGNC